MSASRPTPPTPQDLLRALPPVNDVLAARAEADAELGSREAWVEEARGALAALRARVLGGDAGPLEVAREGSPAALLEAARRRLRRRRDPGLVRVVNATGVVLHTNLGRAALAPAALEALASHAGGYQLLAADRASGERAPRERHVEALLKRLTGAEAATTVNNNAAATMIALAALASGKEVVVSRGQLVEIGGAYRIPDVMALSGATLREVGTTNRTHLRDYERAIGPQTGLLLRVHTSNYRVVGFAGEVPLDDLVALGRAHGVPVVDDLGSGALVSLRERGLALDEPLVQASLSAGADLVTASGDKLIGGPQMGLLLGRAEAVARVRAHPFYRAVRCDKLSLIAMEATLRLFLDPDRLAARHPTFAALTATPEALRARAEALALRIREAAPGLEVDVVAVADAVGAGSLPTVELPGSAVRLRSAGVEAGALARALRLGAPPVFSTVSEGAVHLHVRTLLPDDEAPLLESLRTVPREEDDGGRQRGDGDPGRQPQGAGGEVFVPPLGERPAELLDPREHLAGVPRVDPREHVGPRAEERPGRLEAEEEEEARRDRRDDPVEDARDEQAEPRGRDERRQRDAGARAEVAAHRARGVQGLGRRGAHSVEVDRLGDRAEAAGERPGGDRHGEGDEQEAQRRPGQHERLGDDPVRPPVGVGEDHLEGAASRLARDRRGPGDEQEDLRRPEARREGGRRAGPRGLLRPARRVGERRQRGHRGDGHEPDDEASAAEGLPPLDPEQAQEARRRAHPITPSVRSRK